MLEPTQPTLDRREWLGLVGLVAAAAAIRLWFGLGGDGIYHPDEIYQVLEPAHRAAFGYGLDAWEWDYGARNWFLPGLLAGYLKVVSALGLSDPLQYVGATRGLVAVLHASAGIGVYLLARQHRVGPWLAAIGAALFLFNPASIYLGFRTLSETISAPMVVFGLYFSLKAALQDEPDEPRWPMWLGMSLLGASVLMRLQNAMFIVPLVLFWRFRGREHVYAEALKVLVAWALLYGAIDWITWGLPFQSAGAYLRFNVLMDGSTYNYGAEPFYQYVVVTVASMGALGALTLLLPLAAWERATEVFACAMLFFGLHCAFPHKDLRFVSGTWPLLAALSAVGLDIVGAWLAERFDVDAARLKWALAGLMVPVVIVSAAGVGSLTFGQLGQSETLGVEPKTRALDYQGPVNRLLARASEREDMCGLFLQGEWATNVGGHTYLHRDVPFFHAGNPPESPQAVNYVLARKPHTLNSTPVDTGGEYRLYRVRSGGCAATPEYRPRIFVPIEGASDE
ncbi:MAG: hypothetical protein ACQEVA_09880 [Myxococcota bacterium]